MSWLWLLREQWQRHTPERRCGIIADMLHIQIAIKQKLSSAIPHLELQTLKIFEVAEVIGRKGMPQRRGKDSMIDAGGVF